MPRHGTWTRRSASEWTVRGLLAAAAVIIGSFSFVNSLAQVLASSNIELSHALAPYDGRITALMAASLAGPDATAADRRRADRLAQRALQHQPTAVVAVSTLAINAQVRGDTTAARRLFAFSQKLSRRDLQTQIWAIEDAVSRGDIPDALRHYDITLRTTPRASEILYPVLAAAVADPAIQGPLVETLADTPVWSEAFINYVALNGPDPRATARLFRGLRGAGVIVPEGASAGAVNALIAGGFLDDAWGYYASVRPGADRRRSRDRHFTAALVTPSQLDWTPISDARINASIQRGDRGGVVDFSAPASIGGPLLQQMQMLPPGDYRIEGHSVGIDQVDSARPYWVLICRDGRELGRVVVSNSAQADGGFAGQFSVPQECPVQTLVLVARPSDAVSGLSGQIDRVQLAPIR